MSPITTRHFASGRELVLAAAALLEEHLTREFGGSHGVLLSGGATPLPVYREVADRRVRTSERAFVVLGDERMAPEDTPDSNYGNLAASIRGWGVPEERILRPLPALGLKTAARAYDGELRLFLKSGGRLTLGFLGLGADGHTASLFTPADVARGGKSCAIPVPRKTGLARVSVTPELLARVRVLVILLTGKAEKQEVAERLLREPESVTAGLALRGHAGVQVWMGWKA